ncbi:hypothetical protein [Streptomyces sp. NPDC101145]|uniref:hypothetical protein n=1 Tax=Streptomyces sp. NPDC101145 TaxID=3366112 RepID=UPI003826DD92
MTDSSSTPHDRTELVTWCRIFRVGPVCPKPCDDCRTTSRINALARQQGTTHVTLADAHTELGITPSDTDTEE